MDIAKLRELLEAATPGPWGKRHEAEAVMPWCIVSDSLPYVASMCHSTRDGREEANAALIVAAVNALPSLLARLEAAEADNNRMAKALDAINERAANWHTGFGSKANRFWIYQVSSGAIDPGDALTTYDQEKARG